MKRKFSCKEIKKSATTYIIIQGTQYSYTWSFQWKNNGMVLWWYTPGSSQGTQINPKEASL